MSISRRNFLKAVVVTASAIPLAASPRGKLGEQAVVDLDLFPQSVASGDPKPDSVVLWTRAPATRPGNRWVPLRLEVATDRRFRRTLVQATVVARPEFDYCLRVKVTGLRPRARYCYRFLHLGGPVSRSSPTGRFKTAPAPWDDVPVRFGLANCQDFIGRYYNAYLPLLEPEYADLDFILQLGDYIYETTGDPSFQSLDPDRAIRFDDEEGAISLGTPDESLFAARSLDNYRQLYRSYRSDPVLQRLHERFPSIHIWDDHEFSDDSWQDRGTYFDGRLDEQDTERKRNAEQAWFEYTPIDDADDVPQPRWRQRVATLSQNPARRFPDTRIFRQLRYGRHLHLAMLDTRSFRPDHLVPEDAFPGAVVLDEPILRRALGDAVFEALRDSFSRYVDFADLPLFLRSLLQLIVSALYQAQGLDAAEASARSDAVLQGDLDVNYLNLLIAGIGVPGIAPLDPTGLPRGISFLLLGKQALFASQGARNLTVAPTFDLYARILSSPIAEDVLGETQESNLRATLSASNATWKLVCSSVSFTSMVMDLTQDPAGLSLTDAARGALTFIQENLPQLAQRFYLSNDQWDGFPNKRAELLDFFRRRISNVVLLSGDIHAGFATDHGSERGRLFELTGPAVSSATFQDEVANQAVAVGLGGIPGIFELIAGLNTLIDATNGDNPLVSQSIEFSETGSNGVVVAEVSRKAMRVRYLLLPGELARSSCYEDPDSLLAFVQTYDFEVPADRRMGITREDTRPARAGARPSWRR
jgi:alkaline phosphatase D